MDTATTMSSDWIPSRVSLGRELPVMLDAPFATVKQENYFTGEVRKREVRRFPEEKERSVGSGGAKDSTVIKTETTTNGPQGRVSPMRINHRAQIDVVDVQHEESAVYKYLLIYEEQYSKFVVLRPLRSKESREVAAELAEIVTTIGAPRIIQSGNGRAYAEQVVREIRVLLPDFCVVHGDAARNAHERRDFASTLRTWTARNPGRQWQEGLAVLQVLENTTANSRTGEIPSQLFFGRNICEDLRRTIGGKGSSTGNAVAEEATASKRPMDRGSIASENIIDRNVNHLDRNVNHLDRNVNHLDRNVNHLDRNVNLLDRNVNNLDRNVNNLEVPAAESLAKGAEDRDSRDIDRREKPDEKTPNDRATAENETSVDPDEASVDGGTKNFRCKICHKQYVKLGHLRNHTKTHTRIGNFECAICRKTFRLSSLYDKHMQRLHEDAERNEDSEACDRLAVETDEIIEKDADAGPTKIRRIDVKSAEPKEPKKSPSHSKPTNSSKKSESPARRRLDNSSTRLNRNPRLECTYCKQKFNFPSVLKRHMRSHTNERPYVCQVCNKSFKQLGHLSQHALTHTDYRSFTCAVCSTKFESLDALKLHSHSHKDETFSRTRDAYRLFECDSCKKVFTTKSVLERHIFTHTHERQFGCKVCGKRFKQAGHVKSHMLVHTGERRFECTVCSKRFSLSNSLKKHMYVHNGEKPYQCDVCGARFLEKRNLNGHLMTHTNERPFSCKICGKRYTLADTLRRHVSAAHEDGRTYQCEICAKMFKQLAHLSVHKKVHNDERPFQCHLCEKNFKHKNVLKSHLAIHANVRPFECDACKATFVRKTNLQTHIASAHMNERPYVCTICNKRFKQISHLNGHIVVHSNSMPYQCDFCDRRCNRLDNLKKHMRLHAKNKE